MKMLYEAKRNINSEIRRSTGFNHSLYLSSGKNIETKPVVYVPAPIVVRFEFQHQAEQGCNIFWNLVSHFEKRVA